MTLDGIGRTGQAAAAGLPQQTAITWQPSTRAAVESPVTDAPEARISVMNDVLRPYLLLACVAFVLGFASYLAVGSVMTGPAQLQDDWQASISVPTETPLAQGKLI